LADIFHRTFSFLINRIDGSLSDFKKNQKNSFCVDKRGGQKKNSSQKKLKFR